MLAALLLSGLVAAPLTSLALLTFPRRRFGGRGWFHAGRRFVYAVAATAVTAAVDVVLLRLFGVGTHLLIIAVGSLVAMCIVWLPLTRRWGGLAHVAWACGVYLFLAYLGYLMWWTFASHLGPVSTVGGLLLWVLEAFTSFLACAYLWELCDSLGTEDWRRRVTPTTTIPVAAPFVSLHVPAHNEPPEMVIETLQSLLRLDYPAYEIIAIDDNSEDEDSWRPIERWCAVNGVKFVHLSDWPGYKSGALNFALQRLTDPRAEVIGVVDSDYQVHPSFLRRCAPLFAVPEVGFVQAPQDYRDWLQDPFYRRLYYSYQYFFAVTQPSRNEHDGAIFAGTMGLIRRRALEQLGGWDEWCITEDAELSLRLLRAGWSGLHIDESFGCGVMPLTFEALKSQRYRWCFGGIQLLRMHWRSLFSRSSAGRLSAAQRWAYLCGAIQWYGDLMGVVFFVLMLGGAVNLATGGGQLFRKMTVFLVAAISILVTLGLVRALSLMRRGTGASVRDALGAFFIWQSTGLTVARASVQGLFARKAAFLRTPKVAERASIWRAFAANWAETALGILGVAAIVASLTRLDTASGPLLAVLLVVPTIGLLAAPANSLAAQRAALPPELRARRQSEWRRDGRAVVGGATMFAGAGAVVAAIVALFALLVAPSPHFTPPHLTEPARPHHSTGPVPSPSGSASPSSQPSGAPSSTPSPSASAPTGTPAPSNPPTSPPSGAPSQPNPSGS